MKKSTRKCLDQNCWNLHQITEADIIIDFFSEIQTYFKWFQGEGSKLLNKEFLSLREWEKLNDKIRLLNKYVAGSAIKHLHLRVLEKGVISLVHFATTRHFVTKQSRRKERCQQWFSILEKSLRIDRPDAVGPDPYGFGSDYRSRNLRWEIVDGLVPVADSLEDKWMLKKIANMRYGDDYNSIGSFIADEEAKWGLATSEKGELYE